MAVATFEAAGIVHVLLFSVTVTAAPVRLKIGFSTTVVTPAPRLARVMEVDNCLKTLGRYGFIAPEAVITSGFRYWKELLVCTFPNVFTSPVTNTSAARVLDICYLYRV